MRIRLVEPIQTATAVTNNHAQLREALENVPVPQELRREVLLGVETQLVVVRHDTEAAVERIRPVHDDRNAPLLALLIQRVPVRLVHPGRGAASAWIRTGIGGDEAKVLDAPFQFAKYVRRIRRIAPLRQLRSANEAIRKILHLLVNAVIDEASPI